MGPIIFGTLEKHLCIFLAHTLKLWLMPGGKHLGSPQPGVNRTPGLVRLCQQPEAMANSWPFGLSALLAKSQAKKDPGSTPLAGRLAKS